MEVNVLLTDAYESLCRGCTIYKVYYPTCKSILPPVPLHQPGQLNKPSFVKCALCATVVKYRGLNSLLGWYNPFVHTVNSAFGIFLTVKGSAPISSYVEVQYSAGKMLSMLPLLHWGFLSHSWTFPQSSSSYSKQMPS